MSTFLIYGATGYTGRLCAEHAMSRGLRPVLAGRNADALRVLGEDLGLEWRSFGLDRPAAVRDGLAGMKAVLHGAGPFSATARPLADACLATGVHYVDITGEIDVFEALAARHRDAEAGGVMLLPGAGFDVVPSDCLAAHIAARLPSATRLRISIGGFQGISRGTAKTMLEGVAYGTRVRRAGRIVEIAGTPRASADFGFGPRPTIGLGWGDVATAWYSTRIPDIEVFFQASPTLAWAAAMPRPLKWLLARGFSQRVLKRGIERRLRPGPTHDERLRSQCHFVAEAWDGQGRRVVSRMRSPEGYTLTAHTAVEIARRAAIGDVKPGFQTPATAYGADFILSFEGIERLDL